VNRIPFYGTIILPGDDQNAAPIRARAKRRALTYGFSPGFDFEGRNLEVGPSGVHFDLLVRGEPEGSIELSVAGAHNAHNALAAVAAGWELGVPLAAIRGALRQFGGVGRRLERRGDLLGALWIDDYGHHPTEIEAAVAALTATYGRRIVAVFQPHRYTRTQALADRFATAFRGVAEVVLLPIYSAGEAPIPGINSDTLAERIRKGSDLHVRLARDYTDAASESRGLIQDGDLFLTIGAGDVYKVGEILLAEGENAPAAAGTR
jgi:UDP-N-acetylmuramate--alanine ligase